MNIETGTVPLIVHFVGMAQWSIWGAESRPNSVIYQIFKEMMPEVAVRIFDNMDARADGPGPSYQMEVRFVSFLETPNLFGRTYLWILRTEQCVRCNLLGESNHGRTFFPGLLKVEAAKNHSAPEVGIGTCP